MMNEDLLNMSIRKFLKKVGIASQREIEKAINNALDSGNLSGNEAIDVCMTLEIKIFDLKMTIEDQIKLE